MELGLSERCVGSYAMVSSWFLHLSPVITALRVYLRHLWPSGNTPLVPEVSGKNCMRGEERENKHKVFKRAAVPGRCPVGRSLVRLVHKSHVLLHTTSP